VLFRSLYTEIVEGEEQTAIVCPLKEYRADLSFNRRLLGVIHDPTSKGCDSESDYRPAQREGEK